MARRWALGVAALAAALVPWAAPARAGIVVTARQVGSDVVVSGGGTADTTGLTNLTALVPDKDREQPAGVSPGTSGLLIGPQTGANDNTFDVYGFLAGPNPLGSAGPSGAGEASASSDVFGITNGSAAGDSSLMLLLLPTNYVSGTVLSGSMTFANTTLAGLGLTPGVYTWGWDTKSGGADFFTLNVVPEPSALALAAIGSALALGAARRRRASAV